MDVFAIGLHFPNFEFRFLLIGADENRRVFRRAILFHDCERVRGNGAVSFGACACFLTTSEHGCCQGNGRNARRWARERKKLLAGTYHRDRPEETRHT